MLQQLKSGWGVVVPGLIMAGLAYLDLSFSQWRVLVVLCLLATTGMLYHKQLRHFVLLPSCIAFASGLLLAMMGLGV